MATSISKIAPIEIAGYPPFDTDAPVDVASPVASVDESGAYGLPWEAIFKIKNTVALRACERYGRLIPEEEFFSMGNLAVCEALARVDARKHATFPSFLWLVLKRRMHNVVLSEWAGSIRRTYSGSRAKGTYREASITLIPPRFVPLSEALLTTAPCDDYVLLEEIARHVQACETKANAHFFLEYAIGATPTELQHKYGPPHDSIVHRIAGVRRRVVAWLAEEVAHA